MTILEMPQRISKTEAKKIYKVAESECVPLSLSFSRSLFVLLLDPRYLDSVNTSRHSKSNRKEVLRPKLSTSNLPSNLSLFVYMEESEVTRSSEYESLPPRAVGLLTIRSL